VQADPEPPRARADDHPGPRDDDLSSQVSDGLGGGKLTWNLKGQVIGANTDETDGDLAGFLEATIDWNQPRPNTTFSSTCVVQVHTSVGFLESAGYVGAVSNFPLTTSTVAPQGSSTTAVVYVNVDRVRPRVADLGFTMARGECQLEEPIFGIKRPAVRALGSKTGNGGRSIFCVV